MAGWLLAQQLFLGRPAGEPECTPLLGVEPRAAELLLDVVGQRQVDIVAAEHQVVADGDPAEPGAGRRLDDGDQAEVGRPAADIADQDQLAGADLALPAVLVRDDPAVKRRLRLLQERDRGELRPLGGLERQLAGGLVERGRHGQHDLLVFEAIRRIAPGKRVVPGIADVPQVRRRRLDRRDLLASGGLPQGRMSASRSIPA